MTRAVSKNPPHSRKTDKKPRAVPVSMAFVNSTFGPEDLSKRDRAALQRPDRDAAQSQECLDRERDDAAALTSDGERSGLFESGI